MRYHYDQLGAGYLFEKLHYLHAGRAVESARRLVRQDYFGIVYDGARDRHSLHLTARKLVGKLFHLPFQPDDTQSFFRPPFAFCKTDTRKGHRHRDVIEYSEMLNEIVTLKNETYPYVAVRIPVHVLIFLSGYAVDRHIAVRVPVQTAYDIEHGRLTATAVSEYGHEFGTAEFKIYPFKRVDDPVARLVIFCDSF